MKLFILCFPLFHSFSYPIFRIRLASITLKKLLVRDTSKSLESCTGPVQLSSSLTKDFIQNVGNSSIQDIDVVNILGKLNLIPSWVCGKYFLRSINIDQINESYNALPMIFVVLRQDNIILTFPFSKLMLESFVAETFLLQI